MHSLAAQLMRFNSFYFLCLSVTTLNFHSLSIVDVHGKGQTTVSLYLMQDYLAFLEEAVIIFSTIEYLIYLKWYLQLLKDITTRVMAKS